MEEGREVTEGARGGENSGRQGSLKKQYKDYSTCNSLRLETVRVLTGSAVIFSQWWKATPNERG